MNAVIINHDRYTVFKQLLWWMTQTLKLDVTVFDNASTYPPLIEFYNQGSREFHLVRYAVNEGHNGAGLLAYLGMLPDEPVLITDPDLLPYRLFPGDFPEVAVKVLDLFPDIVKVGPFLEYRDLPDHYPLAQHVKSHEMALYREKLVNPALDDMRVTLRKSYIDTTFAVYRSPRLFGDWRSPAGRMMPPYRLCHPDWYVDPARIPKEYWYYLMNCNQSASYAKSIDGMCRLTTGMWHGMNTVPESQLEQIRKLVPDLKEIT